LAAEHSEPASTPSIAVRSPAALSPEIESAASNTRRRRP
jgi:hypothetical protein